MTPEEKVEQLVTHSKDGIKIGGFLLKTGGAPGQPAPTEKAIGIVASRIRALIVSAIREFQTTGGGAQAAAPAAAPDGGAGSADEPEPAQPTVIVNEQLIQLVIDAVAKEMSALFASSDVSTEITVGTARQAALERAKMVTAADILAALPPELLAQPAAEAPAAAETVEEASATQEQAA